MAVTKIDLASQVQGQLAPTNISQDSSNRLVSDSEKSTWNGKAETSAVTTSVNGLMSAADKAKLDGVAASANNYSHPASHSLDMITETTSKKIMTDAERSKLSGIEANANNYSHPANHPATMITEDASHRFVSDAEKSTWNGKADTDVATGAANGLMSASDKSKLDGVAANANNYSLPAATGSSLGGVKVGSTLEIATEILNVKDASETQKGVAKSLKTEYFDGDGSTTQFALTYTIGGYVAVFLAGLRQTEGSGKDFTTTSNKVTFNAAPKSGQNIVIDYIPV